MRKFTRKPRYNPMRKHQPREPWERQNNAIFIARAGGNKALANSLASMSAHDFNETFKGC